MVTTFMQVMMRVDSEFLQTPQRQHGSTSVWCVVRPLVDGASEITGSAEGLGDHGSYQMSVVNLGDSRCVHFDSTGSVLFCTQDHKPYIPMRPE